MGDDVLCQELKEIKGPRIKAGLRNGGDQGRWEEH